MVNTGAHIEKFQIKRTADGDFEIGGRIFATIPDIIERFRFTFLTTQKVLLCHL